MRNSCVGSAVVKLRVVTVPASIHAGLPLASMRAVYEYIGKNVGIRRASGEFILATNPDVVFSTQLVEELKNRRLREDTFYRIDRADVASPVPPDASARQIEDYCRENVLRVYGRWFEPGENRRSPLQWLLHGPAILRRVLGAAVRYHMCSPLRFGAPGDFILMHQRQWHEMRGLPELEVFADRSWNLDTLAVVAARYHGLRQEVFGDACVLYHQEHGRDRTERWEPPTRFVYDSMHALHKPWRNSGEWGLGGHTLPDQIV